MFGDDICKGLPESRVCMVRMSAGITAGAGLAVSVILEYGFFCFLPEDGKAGAQDLQMIQDLKQILKGLIPERGDKGFFSVQSALEPVPDAGRTVTVEKIVAVEQGVAMDTYLQVVSQSKRNGQTKFDRAAAVLQDMKYEGARIGQFGEQKIIKVRLIFFFVILFVEKADGLLAFQDQPCRGRTGKRQGNLRSPSNSSMCLG